MSTRSNARRPLVDRRFEVAAFRAALQRVTERSPVVIRVSGEIGIGRTRLLEEFAALADGSNAALLLARGDRQHEAPFAPLLAGSLSDTLQPLRDALSRPAGEDFARGIAAAAEIAASVPLWLLIDDLHMADEATRAFTERLLAAIYHGSLHRCRIGVVVSLLADESARALAARLEALDPGAATIQLELPAFDHEAVAGWLGSRFPVPPAPELVALLAETSGGNPLLLDELTRHLQRAGQLEEHDGHLWSSAVAAAGELPRSLTALLQTRTHSVSAECRRVLTLASCLGDSFRPAALVGLLGRSTTELEGLLAEARAAALIEDRGNGCLAFPHASARDFFYAEPNGAEQENNHLRIGEGLIGELGDGADEHCLTIAHHLIRAGRRADADAVVRFASRAGTLALAHHSYFLAGRYFEAAARAGTDKLTDAERAGLYCDAGEAFQRWSDVARSDACFRDAAALFAGCSDVTGYARALHGCLRNAVAFGDPGGGMAAGVAELQRLLTDLPGREVELRVRIYDTLAACQHARARYDEAEGLARTAMTLAGSSSDPALRCIPVTSLALAQMEQLRLSDAKATWMEGLSFDRAAGVARYEGYHLQRLPVPLYCLGELHEAARYNQASYRHNRAMGNTGELCINLSIDTMIANLRGDFDTAIRSGREALSLITTTRYLWVAAPLIAAVAYALAMRQRFEEAESAIDQLVTPGALFVDVGPYRGTAARLQQLLTAHRYGPLGNATTSAAADGGHQPRRGVRIGSLARLCGEAELALLQRDPRRLSGVHDTLEFVHRRGAVLAMGWCCSVPRALAASSALRGDVHGARAGFDEARRLTERCDAEIEAARVDLYQGLAGLATAEGRRLDPERHLTRALDAFTELDAPALAGLARQALAPAYGPFPIE